MRSLPHVCTSVQLIASQSERDLTISTTSSVMVAHADNNTKKVCLHWCWRYGGDADRNPHELGSVFFFFLNDDIMTLSASLTFWVDSPFQKVSIVGLWSFVVIILNKLLTEQRNCRWLETSCRSCDVSVVSNRPIHIVIFSDYCTWNVILT